MAKRVNAEEFEAEVLKASLPVIVEFYSDSCIPCKQLSPVLGGIEDDYEDKLIVVKVNVNFDAELAQKYEVAASPTLLFFKEGKEVNRIRGLVKRKELEEAVEELTLISGQKPIVTTAKKSIAGFKVREGQAIGCKVTLRGERMYEFLDKLVSISLPRVRDFRGVPKNSFDGRGNYTLGVKEQLIFPEIDFDKVAKLRGMDIVFVTTAKTDEEGRALLTELGMPFAK